MKITITTEQQKTLVALDGRLDTTTAPELDTKLSEIIPSVTELCLDFASLEYISSAGLRVLLSAQKKMANLGAVMVLKNVNETVMEVFEITGFNDVLTIK